MVEKKVEDYIKKLLKTGYSKNVVKEQLIKAGFDENTITPAINSIQEQLYPEDTTKKWQFAAAVASVILVIGVTLYFLTGTGITANICNDTNCLTAAAEACQDAVYYQDVEGTKVKYEIKGCTLTKTITEFGPKEPQELRDLLSDKSLDCLYEKGNFDKSWIDVFGGLDKCNGNLKDTVYELRMAQYNLGLG